MEFTSRPLEGVVVAAPVGRIDHASAEHFQRSLAPLLDACVEGRGRIVLDLSGVDYISSVGLRVLMLAAKQVKAQHGEMVIAGMQPVVREIFEISRFTFVFGSFATLGEALARLAPDSAVSSGSP